MNLVLDLTELTETHVVLLVDRLSLHGFLWLFIFFSVFVCGLLLLIGVQKNLQRWAGTKSEAGQGYLGNSFCFCFGVVVFFYTIFTVSGWKVVKSNFIFSVCYVFINTVHPGRVSALSAVTDTLEHFFCISGNLWHLKLNSKKIKNKVRVCHHFSDPMHILECSP